MIVVELFSICLLVISLYIRLNAGYKLRKQNQNLTRELWRKYSDPLIITPVILIEMGSNYYKKIDEALGNYNHPITVVLSGPEWYVEMKKKSATPNVRYKTAISSRVRLSPLGMVITHHKNGPKMIIDALHYLEKK